MPMYEYQCGQCGRRTEKRQKFSDAPLTECPFCGGPLKKLISAPAVQFKGGGWYADGYGSKSTAKASAEGSSSSGEGSSSASAKSDSGSATGEGSKASSDSTATASSSAPASTPAATSSGTK